METQGKVFPLKTMCFSVESLDYRQNFWKELLRYHTQNASLLLDDMPKLDLNTGVLSYMIDKNWEPYLKNAIKHDGKNKEWYSLHLGILYYEHGHIEEALGVLECVVSGRSAPIVLRTIGAIYNTLGKKSVALLYYEKAYNVIHAATQHGIKEDFLCGYFQLLYETKHYTTLWRHYESMVHNDEVITEEIHIIAAQCAFELQKWSALEGFFEMKLERIREGDNILCELWFKKKAYDTHIKDIHEVRKQYTPPENIDFRML